MATAAICEALEDLQCAVCLEEFTRPKVLACKHVFCCECLVKWKTEDNFKCPLCNAKHYLHPGEKVEDLPEPLLISKLLERFSRFMTSSMTDTVERVCDACGVSKNASFLCRNCPKNMCVDCDAKHANKAIFQNHVVIKLSKRTVCQSHTGQLKALYCKNCKNGICELCYDTTHKGHDIVEMQRVVRAKRKKLINFRKSAEAICIALQKSDPKSFIKQVENLYSLSLRQTDDEIDLLSKKLQDAKRLKKTLQMQKPAATKKLSFYNREIEDAMATNENLKVYIDDILAKGDEADIVSCADDLPDIREDYDIEIPNVKVPCVDTVSKRTVQIWTRSIGQPCADIIFDKTESALWVRTEDKDGYIYKYDLRGTFLKKMWKRPNLISICLDTNRNHLVLGYPPNTIITITKETGAVVTTSNVRDIERIYDMSFDKFKDRYIICDGSKHCVWIIDVRKGNVLEKIVTKGPSLKGISTFPSMLTPSYVHFNPGFGPMPQPCVLVRYSDLNGVVVLTTKGEYVHKYGAYGHGYGELDSPIGCCFDTRGRIVVCDSRNKRVVRFGTGPDQDCFEVIVSPGQLDGLYPYDVCIVRDSYLALNAGRTMDDELDMHTYLILFSCD